MGYSTYFAGVFTLDRPLKPEQKAYLEAFSHTRRMKRDIALLEGLADPVREAVGLPLGEEGAYFIGAPDHCCQDNQGVTEINSPPPGQPGLWCGWTPNEDGDCIEHDGGEKFYEYVDWIKYLIKHFLAPWGYVVNGEVEWSGEEVGDNGVIFIHDNMPSASVSSGFTASPEVIEALEKVFSEAVDHGDVDTDMILIVDSFIRQLKGDT